MSSYLNVNRLTAVINISVFKYKQLNILLNYISEKFAKTTAVF